MGIGLLWVPADQEQHFREGEKDRYGRNRLNDINIVHEKNDISADQHCEVDIVLEAFNVDAGGQSELNQFENGNDDTEKEESSIRDLIRNK